jgi:hypothetical protein
MVSASRPVLLNAVLVNHYDGDDKKMMKNFDSPQISHFGLLLHTGAQF